MRRSSAPKPPRACSSTSRTSSIPRRVKLPFGIAQIGKSFRNEITPRNFTFRSREFEQMEMEFFCHPDESPQMVRILARPAVQLVRRPGITSDNLILRDHAPDELSPLLRRHGGRRVCVPVPGAGRIRRTGRGRPPGRLRPAQPHGGQTRQGRERLPGGREGRQRPAEVPRQRQGPDDITTTTVPARRVHSRT